MITKERSISLLVALGLSASLSSCSGGGGSSPSSVVPPANQPTRQRPLNEERGTLPSQEVPSLRVVSVFPTPQSLDAGPFGPLSIEFDRPVRLDSFVDQSFYVFGRWSGRAWGSFFLSSDGHSVSFVPDLPFSAGERVMVVLSRELTSDAGVHLRPQGYSWQFWTRTQPAGLDFTEVDRFSTRSPGGPPTRTYGGFGSDLNGDGYLDLVLSNEDTDDVRTFLNLADGTGRFGPLLLGNFPTDVNSSANEPADFNGDGVTDACIANHAADTLSILLGVGDGTFGPQQLITLGSRPRGVCVLDGDGDGDIDIAVSNAISGDLSVLLNDGFGVFAEASRIPLPYPRPWSIASEDMDGDGILDLVVGMRDVNGGRLLVHAGRGGAGFELVADVSAGVEFWNIATGDVNGDGFPDVSAVGGHVGHPDTSSILFGDGLGGLSSPTVYPSDGFGISSDLGDLDGDGDLDWMLSSFLGEYFLYENDGRGFFDLDQRITPTGAASCAIMMDVDGDRCLDLVLIDETADEVVVLVNDAL